MNTQDALRGYYQQELTYLRRQGANFAARYPKVASRLELGAHECADPHVERLIESFAFLTARIQRQLDSEFPQITSALLGILYPQFLSPVPAMSVAQIEVDAEQGKLTDGHLIPRHTPLFAKSPQGHICRFRTCYPVTLWPLQVAFAGFEAPAKYEWLDARADVATVLRLRLVGQGISPQALTLDRLRFYLHGEPALTTELYELLACHAQQVAILPDTSTRPTLLPADTLAPVGFASDEAVLPYPPQAHPGYRLLQEYFTFPEKFLFIDFTYLDTRGARNTVDLLILLNSRPNKRMVIDHTTFRLGCTPITNLFLKTTEPIRLDHTKTEYRLVPDMRRQRWTEIHSIQHVSATSNAEEDTQTIEPLYSFNHHMATSNHTSFWHGRRLPTGRMDLPGTEMRLSFVDLDFNPNLPPTQTVYAHTLCTNRDLAENLRAGALLQIEEVVPQAQITCLHKPTSQLDPPLGGATLWRLISHLSLNHLSLASGPESLNALREILKLYCITDDPSNDRQIRGIRHMTCRPVVNRIGSDAWRGFCRGTEVTLEFDEDQYTGSSAVLFASVLSHFFALYTSINSFTQLVMKSQDREGIVKRWPPMAGRQVVL